MISETISASETPSSFAISPTTDTLPQKKHRYTDTEATKADMVAFKGEVLKEMKEQAAVEMVTFKNEIVEEVKVSQNTIFPIFFKLFWILQPSFNQSWMS